MNQQARLGLIILALLALLGIGGAFYFYQANQKAGKAIKELQTVVVQRNAMINSLQQEKQDLQASENRLIDQQQTLEEQAALARRELEGVKRELTSTKDELTAVNARVATLQGERDALASELGKLRALREELNRTIARLRTDKSALDKTIAGLEEQVARLEEENKRLKEDSAASAAAVPMVPRTGASMTLPPAASASAAPSAVTLPPIIVQRSSTVPRIPLTGHIINVNQAHRFVIVDKGAVDGLGVGDRFLVTRGRQAVGTVTVIRVRDTIAACDTKSLGQAQPRVGDTVTLQVP